MTTSSTITDDPAHPVSMTAPHRPPVPGRRSPGRTIRSLSIGSVLILLAGTTVACGSGSTTTTTSSAAASSSATSSSATSSAAAKSAAATSGSTSYPAGKEQICQARDQLRTSVTALTNMEVLASGTDAIKASVKQIQTDLDAIKTAGKQDYQTQVTALQTSLEQLKTAADNLGNGNASENTLGVATAIAATGVAAEALFTQLKTSCGS